MMRNGIQISVDVYVSILCCLKSHVGISKHSLLIFCT
jgi:hypothetical protein